MTFLRGIDRLIKKSFAQKILKNRLLNYIIISIVILYVLISNIYSMYAPTKYDVVVGDIATIDIKAPYNIKDVNATLRAQEQAIEMIEPSEEIDPLVQIEIENEIKQFFNAYYKLRELSIEDTSINIYEEMKENNPFDLNDHDFMNLGYTHIDNVRIFEEYIKDIIRQVMMSGVNLSDVYKTKTKVKEYISRLDRFSEGLKDIGIKIAYGEIKQNKFLDEELTQMNIDTAMNSVDSIYVKRGQTIVGEGDVITDDVYNLLKDAGLIKNEDKKNFNPFIGVVVISFILYICACGYIYFFQSDMLKELSKLYLITILFIVIFLAAKPFNLVSIYLLITPSFAMLLSVLVNPTIAIVLNIFLSISVTMATGNTLFVLTALLASGTVGAIAITKLNQRSGIFISGMLVSLTNVIISIAVGLLNGTAFVGILTNGLYALANGLICAVFTIGSLPLWEYLFNILTPIKLLELSNPNNPLLKRLLVEAPGTYHHSIIVGNLSEAAAEAIGCNSLLARVGSYYHDVGKMKRPYFFKENQLTIDNPHDKISPYLSADIIKKHVTDGLELANKYNIPKDIKAFITEHHGDTIIKYFYHKAHELDNDLDVNEFKYSGPKPMSKETAIVMMADSVEAAVRTLSEPNKENIESLINKIFDGKIGEDQIECCDLTFKDIKTIKSAFIKTLLGIFHERIEYPELSKDMEEKK